MKIYFYKSALCPRCFMAKRYLMELQGTDQDFEIQEIDILVHPKQAIDDGVRMIPALRIGEQMTSSTFLTKKRIAGFIAKNRT